GTFKIIEPNKFSSPASRNHRIPRKASMPAPSAATAGLAALAVEGGVAVSAVEETLDANGQLRLAHPPQLLPGPVRVTTRYAAAMGSRRGRADVIREVAAEQRSRGFPRRSAADLRAADEACLDEDAERDRELDAARRAASVGGPECCPTWTPCFGSDPGK